MRDARMRSARILLALCLGWVTAGSPASASDGGAATAEPQTSYTERGYIEVRDGVKLQYLVELPREKGRFPTVLNYGPYQSGSDTRSSAQGAIQDRLIKQGFAFVGVNVRGTGCSGGTFKPVAPEQARDGYDVVEWIARQPWSNGKVGMFGVSYPGITQLMVAGTRPPHLSSIIPASTVGEAYRDGLFPGGIPNRGLAEAWYPIQNGLAAPNLAYGATEAECWEGFSGSTTENSPDSALTILREHPYDDPYMRKLSPARNLETIDIPVLAFNQWQDEWVSSRVVGEFNRLKTKNVWMVLGNGHHATPLCDACIDLSVRFLRWTLQGKDEGFDRVPHVQLWLENQKTPDDWFKGWSLEFDKWPPRYSVESLYLRADGRLDSRRAKRDEAPDTYDYPLASASANSVFYGYVPSAADSWRASAPGPGAVVYTTRPLKRDQLALGASLDLWLSSTAQDTDVQVTITEVRPDGQEMYIQRGWLRASHRALDRGRSTRLRPVQSHREQDARPLEPGVPAHMKVEVFPFAHLFRRDSRVRVIIDAPTGTTGLWRFDYLPQASTNKVFHDPQHPSRLLLGVVPGAHGSKDLAPCATTSNQPCRVDVIGGP